MNDPNPLRGAAPAAALVEWYRTHRRDLPWRRTRDPWAIWVSEIMLQQTVVATVVPYWERFLARFPDPAALASADDEELLSLWAGLGYYRRARLLRQAAREVVERGAIPQRAAELETLPGIGPYTAAAIASIAFGEGVPVLDGNVERVVTRWLAEAGDPKSTAVRRRLLEALGSLLDPERPGDSNQALMELGALVCRPREPRCGACPLRSGCRGAAEGTPERFPASRTRRAPVAVALAAVLAEGDAGVLLFRRGKEEALLAGTWELPWVEGEASSEALAARYGGRWEIGDVVGRARHAVTYRRIAATLRQGAWIPGPHPPVHRWWRREEIATAPVSSLVGKLLGVSRASRPARRRG